MSRVFIVSTRSMKDKKGIWANKAWRVSSLSYDSPFIQNILKDCDGSYATALADYMSDKEKWVYEDALSWASAQLKEKNPKDIFGEDKYMNWVKYTLEMMDRTVDYLPWDSYYYLEDGDIKVIAVQHRPYILSFEESRAWVSSLLETFTSGDDYVCLLLHDKDLDGYNHRVSYLLNDSEVSVFTDRINTDIIAFTHSASRVSSIFFNEKIEEFIDDLINIKTRLINNQSSHEGVNIG